jgi:hypothetical protein
VEFKTARLDTPALIATTIATILLAAFAIFFFLQVPFGWVFSIIPILIISLSFLFSPSRYYFRGSDLVIRKVIGREKKVDLNEVEGYAVVPDFSKLRVARTFGNGGLFGYYGNFSTAEYGPLNCQMRNLKNVFVIKTRTASYALSPAAVSQFEEQLTGAVAAAKGRIDILAQSAPGTMQKANSLILSLPIMLFLLTVLMVLLAYSQLPQRIAVHFDLQGNPDGWASRASYLISGIVPAAILAAISIIAFSIVSRATRRPSLAYILVVLFAAIQLFVAYISLETYWVNKHGTSIIPFPYNFIVYFLAIAGLLIVYFRKTKANN